MHAAEIHKRGFIQARRLASIFILSEIFSDRGMCVMWNWYFSCSVCLQTCACVYVYASFSMCDVCFASMSACVAGEDAANDPVQIVNVYPPAVLRRHTLHPNEREEAHLGVSRLRQKSTIRTPYYRRVRLLTTPAHPNINYQEYKTRHLIPVHFQHSLSQWD